MCWKFYGLVSPFGRSRMAGRQDADEAVSQQRSTLDAKNVARGAAEETPGSGRTPPLHLGPKFQEETVAVAGPFVASGRGTMARVVGAAFLNGFKHTTVGAPI